jgi:hypothetical protein
VLRIAVFLGGTRIKTTGGWEIEETQVDIHKRVVVHKSTPHIGQDKRPLVPVVIVLHLLGCEW